MPECHYHDGSAVRKVKDLHYHDGTAIRKVKEAWYHDGTAVRKVYTGAEIVNPLVVPSVVHSALSSAAQSVWIIFYADGTLQGFRQGNGLLWTRNWFTPTQAGIGGSYWVRATLVSGTAPTGNTLNAWHALTGTPRWTLTAPAGGAYQGRACTLQIQIASDAAGANVVTSGASNLSVERET
jgi:hypothetical protein